MVNPAYLNISVTRTSQSMTLRLGQPRYQKLGISYLFFFCHGFPMIGFLCVYASVRTGGTKAVTVMALTTIWSSGGMGLFPSHDSFY